MPHRFITLVLLALLTRTAAAAPPWNVAIVIHDGVELLDFAGPAEVFDVAGRGGPSGPGSRWFDVYTVAPTADPITSQGFVRVVPNHSIDDAPDPDVIVIPGGDTDVLLDDERFMAWVRGCAEDGDTILTVCTGAFVAARLGLLDGKRATTHHAALAGLARAHPAIDVVADAKVVDNGRVLTSAGISSGIEGSLHLVARRLGGLAAEATARHLEYRWTPDRHYEPLNPQLDPAAALAAGLRALRRMDRCADAIELADGADADAAMAGAARVEWASCQHVLGRYEIAAAALRRAIDEGADTRTARYNLACSLSRLGRSDEACAELLVALERGPIRTATLRDDADLEAARSSPRFADVLRAAAARD